MIFTQIASSLLRGLVHQLINCISIVNFVVLCLIIMDKKKHPHLQLGNLASKIKELIDKTLLMNQLVPSPIAMSHNI